MKDNIHSLTQDLQRYKKLLKMYSEKVKNPIHFRTGKPLAKSTYSQYVTMIKALKGLIIKTEEMIGKHSF